nr:MAG TPA: hypothetical protein [Caudoviricetes sp.]
MYIQQELTFIVRHMKQLILKHHLYYKEKHSM